MGNAVTDYVLRQVGKPYVFARPAIATTNDAPAYDCSGLSECAWLTIGVHLTHFVATQIAETIADHVPVAQAAAVPGALLFYTYEGPIPGHVAVNIGDGTLVEAANETEGVIRRKWALTESYLYPTASVPPTSATTTGAATPTTAAVQTVTTGAQNSVSSVAGGLGITDTIKTLVPMGIFVLLGLGLLAAGAYKASGGKTQ